MIIQGSVGIDGGGNPADWPQEEQTSQALQEAWRLQPQGQRCRHQSPPLNWTWPLSKCLLFTLPLDFLPPCSFILSLTYFYNFILLGCTWRCLLHSLRVWGAMRHLQSTEVTAGVAGRAGRPRNWNEERNDRVK